MCVRVCACVFGCPGCVSVCETVSVTLSVCMLCFGSVCFVEVDSMNVAHIWKCGSFSSKNEPQMVCFRVNS